MDKYVCLKESGVEIGDGDDESSSDDGEDDGDEGDDDDEEDERYGEGNGEEGDGGEDSQPKGGLTTEAVIDICDIHAAGLVPDDKACSHYSSATTSSSLFHLFFRMISA